MQLRFVSAADSVVRRCPYSGQASVVVSERNDAGYEEAAIRSGHTTD